MRAMMLLIVEVPTLDHASYIQKEAERLATKAVRQAMESLPRQLRDKEYVVSVTAEPIGEDSTCAALADEVQRLHTIVSVLEEKGRK